MKVAMDAMESDLKNKLPPGARVAVAFSGGVDSAAAALLLKKAGAEVTAVFMKNWEDDDTEAGCHDKADLLAAAAAADRLGVELQVANFAADYKKEVFAPFLRALQNGLTPNPDVLCNSAVKFESFRRHALALGAQKIATGHYARVRQSGEEWQLLKGEDSAKDQSYFLHQLSAEQLSAAVFPLGGLYKTQTRAIAAAAGLPNAARKDSVGICFIGERRFESFIKNYLPENPGDMLTAEGKIVGRHRGLAFHTVGQRRGLRIGGGNGAWYVAEKRPVDNALVVVPEGHPLLYSRTAKIARPTWIAGRPPPTRWVYAARLRHRQPPASCALAEADDNGAEIVFAEPQRAAAPGQYAVLYDGNVCLGGGEIVSTER